MRITRVQVGVVATVVWLAANGALLFWKRSELAALPPNAWGDFFAGCFAPLAFLWLVLGYLQQGEELRLSSDALRLQADELRNSVEQQKALVEASRQQIEAERERMAVERSMREEAIRPAFVGTCLDVSVTSSAVTYRLGIANTGGRASDVRSYFMLAGGHTIWLLRASLIESGEQQLVDLKLDRPAEQGTSLWVRYSDARGRDATAKFRAVREDRSDNAPLFFVPESIS